MAHTLLSYPFRLFFLSSAMAAALLVPIWALLASGVIESSTALPGLLWHQHEMLAGMLYSAIAGFILTAVCAWTGRPPVCGGWLLALWLTWLLPRIGLLLNIAPDLALLLDLLFLPLVAGAVAHRVIASRKWRQLPLIALLLVLWGSDIGFHISGQPGWLHLSILLGGLLVLLIGGRITPAFSRNWLRAQGRDDSGVQSHILVERITAISYLLLLLMQSANLLSPGAVNPWLLSSVAALAGLASLWRLAGWRGWLVRDEPLLWILHLGLLWISIALLLRALAAPGWITDTAWLHAMASGGFGTIILGVMSRVVLGHTGRPLRLPSGMLVAFWLVLLSGFLRVATALTALDWQLGITVSALTWSVAYMIFLWRYLPMLCAPRVDGKPG